MLCGVLPKASAYENEAPKGLNSTYQRSPDSAKNGELNIFCRKGTYLSCTGPADPRVLSFFHEATFGRSRSVGGNATCQRSSHAVTLFSVATPAD